MLLYGMPASPSHRKILALAIQLNSPIDTKFVDLAKGEHRHPEFLKLNPNGRVPVLVDGDFVLWESNAIMQYIASKTKNTLWPDDNCVRADISRWQCWQLSQWAPACESLIWENQIKAWLNMGAADPALVEKGEADFRSQAAVLDAHLAGRDWIVGGALTLADLSLASHLAYAESAKLPWQDFAHLQRWYARIEQLDCWKKSQPK